LQNQGSAKGGFAKKPAEMYSSDGSCCKKFAEGALPKQGSTTEFAKCSAKKSANFIFDICSDR
jgi:hypothetical protein